MTKGHKLRGYIKPKVKEKTISINDKYKQLRLIFKG